MKRWDWSALVRSWWGPLAAGILAAGAYIAQILAGEDALAPGLYWSLTIGGALATLIALVLPARIARREIELRKTTEEVADEKVRKFRTKMHDILIPLSELLDQVITAENAAQRRSNQSRMQQAIVSLASQHLGTDRVRACFLELVETVAPKDPAIPESNKHLKCNGVYSGRDQKPEYVFYRGIGAGKHVFDKIICTQGSDFVREIDPSKFPEWHESRGYRTYIASTVASNGKVHGMLTVDAPTVGDLLGSDEVFVRLLAQILGSAMAVK